MPAADDRPLGPPPASLSPEEAALWERLAAEHGAHLRRHDSAAFEVLVCTLARAAEIRRAYHDADDRDLARAFLQMLSGVGSRASEMLSKLRLPPMYRLGLD